MARITGLPAAELIKAELRAVIMVKLDFASGPILAHNGAGTITFDGDEYVGVGQFGSIEMITEDSSIRPQRVEMSLTGTDSDMIAAALNDEYHLREATVFLAVLDEAFQPIGDPVNLWNGYINEMPIELKKNQSIISLNCMDRLADLDRARPFFLNDQAQQQRFAGDLGLQFVTQAARETKLEWGGSTAYAGGSGGGTGAIFHQR